MSGELLRRSLKTSYCMQLSAGKHQVCKNSKKACVDKGNRIVHERLKSGCILTYEGAVLGFQEAEAPAAEERV